MGGEVSGVGGEVSGVGGEVSGVGGEVSGVGGEVSGVGRMMRVYPLMYIHTIVLVTIAYVRIITCTYLF